MFGERLKELRIGKNMLQKELADLLKVSPSTIGMYERGQRDPDTDTLRFLAEYFDVSIDYLLGRTDERKSSGKGIEVKAYHNLNIDGLSEDEIKQVEDYIEFIKSKYHPDGTLKKK